MEKSTPIGIVSGFLLIFGTVFYGHGWYIFFNAASFLIVIGGTIAALLVTYTLVEVKRVPDVLKKFFAFQAPELERYLGQFTELARTARRDGLLALDRELGRVDDDLMRTGLELAVDGVEEEEISEILQTRITEELTLQRFGARFMTSAGAYAPAFGMVGTLIGLIQMLQNLTDPANIGSGMAVALITTFYGSLLANLLFLPMAAKMKNHTAQVARAREFVFVGVIAIVRGESPSLMERKLRLYLPDTPANIASNIKEMAVSQAA